MGSKELEAMVKFINTYGGRRGIFRIDLDGLKYSDYTKVIGDDILFPEEVLRQMYTSLLRSNELARQLGAERMSQEALWTEHLDTPLWELYAQEVSVGRELDEVNHENN